MSVARNKVVTLDYVLRDSSGRVLEQTEADEPFVYLHGLGQLVPGLERRLDGMEPGQSCDVVVPPEEGHGMPDPEGQFEVPRDAFPPAQELEVGDMLVGETDDGEVVPVRVLKVLPTSVLVDANHPLAGQTLHYSVKVIEVRDATPEEIEHQHAHNGDEHEEDDEDDDGGDSTKGGGLLHV